MDYSDCLKLAGANVLAFERFGSYQGDWWARVILPDGRDGWIHGYFGSCSGCDVIEARLEGSHEHGDTYISSYDSSEWTPDTCADCRAYIETLRQIGTEDLDDFLTQDAAEKKAAENLEWDSDAQAMVDFIRIHANDKPLDVPSGIA